MTSLLSFLDQKLTEIGDATQGLPDDVFHFIRRLTPLINLDLLIQRGDQTLLAWRTDDYGAGWHLMGGIVRFRESFAQRIDEVARLEIGRSVRAEPQACNMHAETHHPRGHFLSHLVRCELIGEIDPSRLYTGSSEPENGQLHWLVGVPPRLYPTHVIYEDWLRRLK